MGAGCKCPAETGCKFNLTDFALRDGRTLISADDVESQSRMLPVNAAFQFAILIMLDVSASVSSNKKGELDKLIIAATNLVKNTANKIAGLEIAVHVFAYKSKEIIGFTTESDKVVEAIESIKGMDLNDIDISTTNIQGAAVKAIDLMEARSNYHNAPCAGRKVVRNKPFFGKVVIFSDGQDRCDCPPDGIDPIKHVHKTRKWPIEGQFLPLCERRDGSGEWSPDSVVFVEDM